jgi:hypothetical protein
VCHYEGAKEATMADGLHVECNLQTQRHRGYLPSFSPPMYSFSRFTQSDVDATITEQVSAFLGAIPEIGKMAAMYFQTIHLWMPVVPDCDTMSAYRRSSLSQTLRSACYP